MKKERKCDVCGTMEGKIHNSVKFGKMLCHKHYVQIQQSDRIVNKNRYEPNEVILHEDYAEIILRNIQGKPVAAAKIDLEDVGKAGLYIFYKKTGTAYCATKNIKLSRLVLGITDPKINVTFKDKDGLNCRKSNLLIGTPSLRSGNQRKGKNNKSGYKGVSWNNRVRKWVASIEIDGKTKTLGYFTDIQEAVKSREHAEEKYFGEFAYDLARDVTLKENSDD